MSRIEIREQGPSELHRLHGVTGNVFIVWDVERGMRVPFGTYRSREQAEARVRRIREREAESND